MKKFLVTALIVMMTYTVLASASRKSASKKPLVQPLSFSDVTWGYLNPARGDASPRSANLWGDCNNEGTSGFLVKFKDGFSSPPHIHNVTYRGVVISGLLHNDDPKAKETWLPAGSFWTQPAGEAHITAAKGEHNIAYIEIDSGPYLVKPESEAFDNGERPVNVDPSNVVWLDASDIAWLPASDNGAKVAFLWSARDEDKLNGTLLKLPAGFLGKLQSEVSTLHAVVIKGKLGAFEIKKALTAGSYFSLDKKQSITLSSGTENESIIYIRTNGKYDVTSNSAEK